VQRQVVQVGNNQLEILTSKETFSGIGKVWIGGTLVRSGRLPWQPMTVSFGGQELGELKLAGLDKEGKGLALRLKALFRPAFTKPMWDHSTDPIHETGDWDAPPIAGEGDLSIVFAPAADRIEEVAFEGLSFHYEYSSRNVPLYFIYDMCSWELDGDIEGATAISQSSCSDPVATFRKETRWTTEGLIHWEDAKSKANPVMTHNLPRWASHQAFDYQFKGNHTLIGLWDKVGLIRSVLRRDSGKPELKVFDKYIFDNALRVCTPAKRILLNCEPRSWVGQQNLWTWTLDEVHRRARAEFGIREEPLHQRLGMNYWWNFTIDTYYRDLLPAAAACGFDAVFVDNLHKSDATECRNMGNMCSSHQFEVAPKLGGSAKLKEFIGRCRHHGITVYAWANPSQSTASPLFRGWNSESDRLKSTTWWIRMPDTRSPYCGAYIPEGCGIDLTIDIARNYWTGCLKKIKRETGLNAYLWDSFYNSAFMPVSHSDCSPHTMWRGVLQALKEMQDAGLHFMIESFGPFGEVQHGCPGSYGLGNLFACYKIMLGSGYTTIPSGTEKPRPLPYPPGDYYRILADMSKPNYPLFYGKTRIDEVFGEEHRRIMRDFNRNRRFMHRRFLQEDGRGILWHDAKGRRATLWNFTDRTVRLPGVVTDVTTGKRLPIANVYTLVARHTYTIAGIEPLPRTVQSEH